jgi:4-hydroxy-tetrahydrodipicolinate synthase
VLGSTGEAPSLTAAERRAIVEAALAMTPAELTVVVGVSHTSVDESISLARHAQETGAKGVLCSAPYYYDNSRDGLIRYLSELDSELELDLVLYDNPVATNTVIDAHDVVSWTQELAHLSTVKLTDHDLLKIPVLQSGGLRVLAGDDPIAFRYMAASVDGVMIIAPALFPEPFRECWDLVQAGDMAAAYEIFARRILPVIHVFGIGDEIATSKVILEELDIFASTEVRAPLTAAEPARRELLQIGIHAAAAGTA